MMAILFSDVMLSWLPRDNNVDLYIKVSERERKICPYITDLPKILFERSHDDRVFLSEESREIHD